MVPPGAVALAGVVLLAGAGAAPAAPAVSTYFDAAQRLEQTRRSLAAELARARDRRQREAVLSRARGELLRTVDRDLFPAWYGTPWDFNGTSEEPGKGTIACGYFVSTVLRDAGFRVQRIRLAQQASERIVRSVAPEGRTWRWSGKSQSEVVEGVRGAAGDGLYVVGLDYHVGFLLLDGGRADFCHSAYLGAAVVVCEPAASSPGMASGYHVVGEVLAAPVLRRWLAGEAIRTVTK